MKLLQNLLSAERIFLRIRWKLLTLEHAINIKISFFCMFLRVKIEITYLISNSVKNSKRNRRGEITSELTKCVFLHLRWKLPFLERTIITLKLAACRIPHSINV